MSCCNPNGLDEMFGGSYVAAERRAFERRGLKERQKRMLVAVGDAGGRTVLDIGGGFGALSLTLLAEGAARASLVEVSRDYLEAARFLAEVRGVGEKMALLRGDFVATETAPADIVLLDRVVCCYPDVRALLTKAARHSEGLLVLTYPKPRPFIKLFRTLLNTGMRVFGRAYRFYLHDEAQIFEAAMSSGHKKVLHRSLGTFGVWQLLVLERSSQPTS